MSAAGEYFSQDLGQESYLVQSCEYHPKDRCFTCTSPVTGLLHCLFSEPSESFRGASGSKRRRYDRWLRHREITKGAMVWGDAFAVSALARSFPGMALALDRTVQVSTGHVVCMFKMPDLPVHPDMVVGDWRGAATDLVTLVLGMHIEYGVRKPAEAMRHVRAVFYYDEGAAATRAAITSNLGYLVEPVVSRSTSVVAPPFTPPSVLSGLLVAFASETKLDAALRPIVDFLRNARKKRGPGCGGMRESCGSAKCRMRRLDFSDAHDNHLLLCGDDTSLYDFFMRLADPSVSRFASGASDALLSR